MEPAGPGLSGQAPLPLLLLLLLQAAGPAGARAETLLDAPRARGTSSVPPSPASVVAPGTTPFEESRLPVFTLDYPHVQIPFEITLWILLASLAKIGERAGRAGVGQGPGSGGRRGPRRIDLWVVAASPGTRAGATERLHLAERDLPSPGAGVGGRRWGSSFMLWFLWNLALK